MRTLSHRRIIREDFRDDVGLGSMGNSNDQRLGVLFVIGDFPFHVAIKGLDASRVLNQNRPVIGGNGFVAHANKNPDSIFLFQQTDVLGDGGLRQVERFGRRGVGFVLRDG